MGLCLCTHILDDDGQLSQSQSFARDIAVLRSKIQARKMPVIWILGDAAAVATYSANVAERFGYACLEVEKIIKEESVKESSRGRMLKAKSATGKKMPDRIVVDLIKEQMILAGDIRGYILAGFPTTPKQGILFTREMILVNCVILLQYQHLSSVPIPTSPPNSTSSPLNQSLLSPSIPNPPPSSPINSPQTPEECKGFGDKRTVLRERERERERDKENEIEREKEWEREREKEEEAVREIVRSSGGKWDLLLEKINAGEPASDIFLKMEAAILDHTTTKI